ncbi:MAG TPA: hypothetical protein VGC89_02130 [Pyrinomonadaceae bacterium]
MALYLCLLSFGLCYWAGRRSLVSGLVAVLAVGYVYGITRANVTETFSHFIFDAGVVGLYAAQLFRALSPLQQFKVEPLRPWLEFLIIWPILLFLIPIQDFLIQFVGLRGNIFLLPFILLGARLDADERYRLALWIAGLNVLAFAFAGTEYFAGLENFFPHNKVTELLYLSKDVVGHTAYRIPATFSNAHAYGGTMVVGLPLLVGAMVQKHKTSLHKQLLFCGITTALLGILMSAARTHFLVAAVLIIVATFSLRSKVGYALGWLILVCGIGWLVSGEQRLQRFMELRNTESVAERVSWSVNMNFFEIAAQYPFGNGLGGGGTSIPYFLQNRIENPVGMENEYARIMLEQGIMGLFIWTLFIIWLLTRRSENSFDSWYLGRRLAWVSCVVFFATGLIGTGLLTSIPQSSLFLLLCGWVGAREPRAKPAQAVSRYPAESGVPAQQYG